MTERKRLPRGIMNNNPGNIERGAPWQGLAEPHEMTEYQRSESRFAVFKHPKWGIRALLRVLITYQDRHNLRTIRQMINRWAPPQGSHAGKAYEQNTSAYVAAVARAVGVGADEPVQVTRAEIARPLVLAIIQHENGMQPYDAGTVDEALRLAGVEVQLKPLTASRTLTGQTAAGGGAAGAAIIEVLQGAQSAIEPLTPYLDAAKWVMLGIIVAGVVITIRARLDDRSKGRV